MCHSRPLTHLLGQIWPFETGENHEAGNQIRYLVPGLQTRHLLLLFSTSKIHFKHICKELIASSRCSLVSVRAASTLLLWCRFNLDIFWSSSTDFFLLVFVMEKCARHFSPDCSISLKSAQGGSHPTVWTFLLGSRAVVLPYPFDALQISFQQAVQRKRDDVVHVLKLEEDERRIERLRWTLNTCWNRLTLVCKHSFSSI